MKIDWLNPKPVATYHYDAAGRLDWVDNFNGTVMDYSYDNADRLTALENKKSGATILASYSFTLDGNGNRTGDVQNEPFAPTPATQDVSYTYNSKKNRLLTSGANSFAYNDEGQLNTGYGAAYTFDYEHRLTAISGQQSVFSYDGAGNRLQSVRNGVTTRYIYDAGGNLLAEADGSNNITTYYIHGAGLLAMVTPANAIYPYHFNAVGSTIALTDSGQNMVNKYSYDSFGNIATNQVENVPQPFKFVGQYGVMTEPNGFYYMRARYYDPEVGRFISEDPIGFEGGINLYAYASNNPLLLIDPLGLKWLAGKDDPHVMGSVNSIPGLHPGDSAMAFFERYVPNFYETSKQHDALLDKIGIKDINKNLLTKVVNIATMPIAFASALVTNIYQTLTGTEETIFGNKSSSSTPNNSPGRNNSIQYNGK